MVAVTDQPMGDVVARLGSLLEAYATDPDGRIRVEDLLSAGAAACGEACMAATGEVAVDSHAFTPGAPIFSDAVNDLLVANASDWGAAGGSVFDVIRSGALAQGYAPADFPPITEPIAHYAATLGQGDPEATWGRVRLSVPADNEPRTRPLQAAFELRPIVGAALKAQGIAAPEWPRVLAMALARELGRVRPAIDPGIAVRIVLETVNGMAKMAPMTAHHMELAARGATTDGSGRGSG